MHLWIVHHGRRLNYFYYLEIHMYIASRDALYPTLILILYGIKNVKLRELNIWNETEVLVRIFNSQQANGITKGIPRIYKIVLLLCYPIYIL